MARRKRTRAPKRAERSPGQASQPVPSSLETIPVAFQNLSDYFAGFDEINPFGLREETFRRIEKLTDRPLLCYVTKTRDVFPNAPAYIDDGDLVGFGDLVSSTDGESVDVFLVSNGGSAEATERIVYLLRERFQHIRFILPANAYSAATLMSFASDEIIMDSVATLGPIDPQIQGVPAQAITRAFLDLEQRLKEEGPEALAAYVPLLQKYDLHILEICKNAVALSKELAAEWLTTYMFSGEDVNGKVSRIVTHFSDYKTHRSHARSINRSIARNLGLKVVDLEDTPDLAGLVRSLCNQYEIWFGKTTFYKMFENARGIHWGRQVAAVSVSPPAATPQAPAVGPPAKPG